MAGRKPRLTEEIAKAIITAISLGATDKTAYESAGVAPSAFYAWIQKGTDRDAVPATGTTPEIPAYVARSPYKEFAEKLKRARPNCIVRHLGHVNRAAEGTVIEHFGPDGKIESIERRGDGDWRASKWLLSVKEPESFSERVVVENRHTGPSGTGPVMIGTISPAALRGMTPDQLRALVTDPAAGVLEPLPDEDEGEDE